MDELALAEYQRRMSAQVCREIIRQSQEHEQEMETKAQKLWEYAHKQLVTFLRTMDMDYGEACDRGGRPLDSFRDEDLAYLIHVRLKALMNKSDGREQTTGLDAARQQLRGLNKDFSDLQLKNIELMASNTKVQKENEKLARQLTSLLEEKNSGASQSPPQANPIGDGSSSSGNSIPDWIKDWRGSESFEKSSMVIQVMGETGKALRASINRELAKRLALPADDESLGEAASCLMGDEGRAQPGLIERIEAIPGKYSDSVLRLSREGQLAYRLLTSREPMENEYERLIRLHSAPEQSILNIQATEMLAEAGYVIKGQAQKVQLPEGGLIVPDIILIDPSTGELILVKVEWGGPKDLLARKQKWIHLYSASKGNLYVFCDSLTSQRAVQAEMNLALAGLVYNSYLTNLHDLQKGKRSEQSGIWLSSKKAK
jgi:hypothetical protein